MGSLRRSRTFLSDGTRDHPPRREAQGDGVPIVVVGVTPHQGGRESRPQGEGAPVTRWTASCEVRVMRNADTVLTIIQVTREPRDTETVMRGSEGGGWKSAQPG